MIRTTFYENFSDKGSEVNLVDVLNSIKNGEFKDEIDELRYNKNDEIRFGELKKQLPHITPSGTFTDRRRSKNLCQYNGIMVLDIDKVEKDANIVRNTAEKIEYSFAAFISPSGSGVKILVKTNATPENHNLVFDSLADFYENKMEVAIDRSGKDISRACFVSYDPDLSINPDSSIFAIPVTSQMANFSEVTTTSDLESIFNNVLNFTTNIDTYESGNRNNFIYKLANNLNRAGVNKGDAVSLISSKFSEPDISQEIPYTVSSAYSNVDEHAFFGPEYFSSASFASLAPIAKSKMGHGTPLIPDIVYEHLPIFLQECTSVFDVPRERDIFFTGALPILSGCFMNVEGLYDERSFSSNLYSFIIAPPASGKGVLNYARQLGEVNHSKRKSDYNQHSSSSDDGGKKPKGFFIPANSSSSAIIRMLIGNCEQGTICETEADTLSATLAQDWGGFDDLLRKAFQHEPVSSSRVDKDSDDVILREINHPRLSICLTGTPSQVSALLKSTENGLFSRFLFYSFQNDGMPVFKDVFTNKRNGNLIDFFSKKSQELFESSLEIAKIGKINFYLNKLQCDKFQAHFDSKLKQFHEQYGKETNAIVYRFGLIAFRIAMILSIFRSIDERKLSDEITCLDDDFESCLMLSNTYLDHSIAVFQTLPGIKVQNHNPLNFLNFLPTEFSYAEAEKIGKVYCNISSRSVCTYLKDLVENKVLMHPKKYGNYARAPMQ
jgi:hypothetical protein